MINSFSTSVKKQIGWYVYRLIDPRSGETFYVGKGKGDRVFTHIRAEKKIENDPDEINPKFQLIREIKTTGLDVIHVIHRHGMSEESAIEVEAALIDAYPGLTNIISGEGSTDYGVMHAKEIIARYNAEEAIFEHNTILINVNRSAIERSLYDAVRFAWVMNLERAKKADVILPTYKGIIIGAFIPNKWLKANSKNFPELIENGDRDGRIGFIGTEASDEIKKLYKGKSVPKTYRKRGAANPIKYTYG